MTLKALSVASEVFPLIKTGGLADVAGALPLALAPLGIATRTILPGYPSVFAAIGGAQPVARFDSLFGGPARLLAVTAAGLDLLVLEAAHLYDRPGGPYAGADGRDHADNWARFAALSRAAAAVGAGAIEGWRPDILHAHDWQAGLVPAYARAMTSGMHESQRPATVITVHNLAFQGAFPEAIFPALDLPASDWSIDGVEYFGQVGYLKAGLQLADAVTTVSPTYAAEITAPEGGMGLDGLLRQRSEPMRGIVNGIDTNVWDPERDPAIAAPYNRSRLSRRTQNKRAVEAEFGLDHDDGPIMAVVSRLTWQKGLDLVADQAEAIAATGVRLAIVGTGEAEIEARFEVAARKAPGRIGVRIGYDEALSHRVQAGADIILVPSRFEPCGLTQLYALRYGCIPLVARSGGLADTVIDANHAALEADVATGIMVEPGCGHSLMRGIRRALSLHAQPKVWRRMQQCGMKTDVSWRASAGQYADLYHALTGPGPAS